MGKSKKSKKEGGKFREYVPVVYARNLTEAEFYKGLLTTNDIPAIIEDEASEVIGMPASIVGQGVPVLVPDEMLDEASEILAEHEDAEEEEELDEYEELEEEGDEELEEEMDEELDEELDEDIGEEGGLEELDEDMDEDIEDLDEGDDRG